MIDQKGWLSGVRHCPSPNSDQRPRECQPDLLIIHNISLPPCSFGGPWIEQLFLNCLDPSAHPYFQEIAHLRVSAHLLVRRDGETIQFVSLHERAWHAGLSEFRGRSACNDYSIGIELEGTDETPYTEPQYLRLVELTRLIMNEYPAITPDRITGHCDVAPGRKSDPGPAFDWPKYRKRLAEPYSDR